ncbi:YqzG/YhdC family protein [Paenibacillus larvae]|uniref:DUF3889 domain-containing protein n=1 Tax=Paenibacillus larvae TaxID=1464 RepID=UPI0001694FB8|nr:DUF3889 domain-containing protein [Paenibacillus larvae]ETK25602.1 hypothetical protein ERIC1_4c00050 [Paenibacillus larvae subsp. larvae DSM 25719]AQR76451.1 hypothetical protein BXP28_02725 [Paenibacillus larvae subsp. larvae]MCY7476007.1 YqzG/YhdC family protein [Paenibacillus larvae]MCY7488936.1 YqzG/YhdC family protein [Paenibacillus larvae]MCY9562334.1 YqzG/YhdC family protein [Paenibacillus larvae]
MAIEIVDYLHVGHKEAGPGKEIEQFKLWIRQKDGREFGVSVNITFETMTQRIISVDYTPAARDLAPRSGRVTIRQ